MCGPVTTATPFGDPGFSGIGREFNWGIAKCLGVENYIVFDFAVLS